jgi:serine/threonine protein phosphatase PrpC
MLESFGLTDVGRRRSLNEDNLIVDPEAAFFVVCDGLGGQNAGEVASSTAVEVLSAFITRSHRDKDITWPYGFAARLSFDGNRLLTAIGLANKKVFRVADSQPDYSGMGTTVVAALVRASTLTVGWVGDSRLYLVRGGTLQALTEDHTWVNMAVREGTISREEAEKHPWKHVLLKAVGGRDTIEPDLVEGKLEHGDVVLLCSDGLHGMLTDDQIGAVLNPPPASLEDGAKALIAAGNEAGGKDNITVILIRYSEEKPGA